MNDINNQASVTKQELKRSFVRTLILVIVFVVATMGALAYFTRTALDIPHQLLPLHGLAGEIKAELVLYHLWLEEMNQGDPVPQSDIIPRHLEQANRLVSAMLEGGEYGHHVVGGLEDEALRSKAEKLQADIRQLKTLGGDRLAHMADARTGIDYDVEFDQVFGGVLQQADRLDAELTKYITQQMKKYELSIFLFSGGIMIFSLIFFFVFSRHNRQRYLESWRLMQSETRTRILFNASVDALITIDEQGLIESFNKAAERIFDYTETEVKGQPFQILLPEPYASEYVGHLQYYARTGETISGKNRELTGRCKNGSTFPMEVAVNIVQLDEQIMFVAIARDISERLAAQAELKELKNTLDQTLDGVYLFDADTLRFFYVNRSACDEIGYSDNELRKMTPVDIKPEFDEPRFRAVLTPLQNGIISSHRFETVHRHKDGHDIPVEISLQYIARENRAGHYVAIVRNITERKQTEHELELRQQRLDFLMTTSPACIYTCRAGGDYAATFISDNVRTSFGYEPSMFLDDPKFWASNIHPDDVDRVFNDVAQHQGGRESYNHQYRFRLSDGSYCWVFDELQTIFDDEGQPTEIVGSWMRIDDLKRAEQELVTARDAAEKANHAKSDFLSRMSHELRTPLNAIVGFSQLLELKELDIMERESVDHILKAGRHLTELINEVLDIARIESGRQHLSLEPVNVLSVLEDVCGLMRPLAARRSIQLKSATPEECNAHVLADLQRLKQVLLNLMSNAVKYNHDGGTVTLFCTEIREGIIRISVSDSGPGIAEENRERVFEAFERLNADESGIEGSGVGLALSKALIETMGGALSLDSELGVGSTFWIELPSIDEVTEQDHVTEASHGIVEIPEAGQAGSATLLYIEDNIANFRLVEVALSRRPHIKLIPAMQGKLGIDLALQHKPDLILLDLHLPDLMGDQVLARLRSYPETQHIPVVIISADAIKRQIEKLLAAGAYAYLTKPFNVKELLHTIDTLLESGADNNANH